MSWCLYVILEEISRTVFDNELAKCVYPLGDFILSQETKGVMHVCNFKNNFS